MNWLSSHRPAAPAAQLTWAVALSLVLHVALLAGYGRPHLLSGVTQPHGAVQLRIVQHAPTATALVAPMTTPEVPTPVLAMLAAPVPTPRDASATPLKQPSVDLEHSTPAVTLPPSLAPAPDYRSAAGLDQTPHPLDAIEPEYPLGAGSIQGTVLLRLLIGSNGAVDEVTVVKATPPGYFEASALTAFGKARFSPGYFLGIPVKSQMFIEVDFTPLNRGAVVSGQSR